MKSFVLSPGTNDGASPVLFETKGTWQSSLIRCSLSTLAGGRAQTWTCTTTNRGELNLKVRVGLITLIVPPTLLTLGLFLSLTIRQSVRAIHEFCSNKVLCFLSMSTAFPFPISGDSRLKVDQYDRANGGKRGVPRYHYYYNVDQVVFEISRAMATNITNAILSIMKECRSTIELICHTTVWPGWIHI